MKHSRNLVLFGLVALAATLAIAFPPDPATAGLMSVVVVGSVLDVFKQDAFSITSLTDSINTMEFMPGRAGQVIDWFERGVPATSIMLEDKAGVLTLVNPTPRGGPGTTMPKIKRGARTLAIPHYEIDDGIMADEVQGVREFGQEQSTQTVVGVVNDRMAEHVMLRMDPTLEYQRMGALKGIILNGDGSTLYNLFTEFGVSQETEVDCNLDSTSADGSFRATCTGILRKIAKNNGGQTLPKVWSFCSDSYWDALIKNAEVRATYLAQQEAQQLRNGVVWDVLSYGGIVFENYRGSAGGSDFIAADKAHFFPVGVPGLFRTVFAPADYNETVNTIGLPRYAKQYAMDNDKGVNMELQSNALSYCTKPKTLMKGKLT